MLRSSSSTSATTRRSSPTQRIGIQPDLEVRPTIAGIRDGRDEVLEAAVSRALGRAWRLTGDAGS
jgi:hypothetical protein